MAGSSSLSETLFDFKRGDILAFVFSLSDCPFCTSSCCWGISVYHAGSVVDFANDGAVGLADDAAICCGEFDCSDDYGSDSGAGFANHSGCYSTVCGCPLCDCCDSGRFAFTGSYPGRESLGLLRVDSRVRVREQVRQDDLAPIAPAL